MVSICFLGWRMSRGMWGSWTPSSTDISLSSITRRQLVLGTLIRCAERRLNRNSPVIILKEVTLAANQLSSGKAGRWEGRKVVWRPLRPGIHWEYCGFCLFSYKQKSYTQACILLRENMSLWLLFLEGIKDGEYLLSISTVGLTTSESSSMLLVCLAIHIHESPAITV